MTGAAVELQQRLNNQVTLDYTSRIAAHQNDVAQRQGQLVLLANGDSWFDYPLDGMLLGKRTDVIAQLPGVCSTPPSILNLAHYGDTTTQEIGRARQQRIVDAIHNQANGQFDGLLISGGGNDLVGDSLCIWLNDAATVDHDPAKAINWDRFNGALAAVRAAYLDLIDLRNRHLPDAPIFVHDYDFPLPTGIGVCTVGPWLKPSLEYRGWTDPEQGALIVRMMLQGFAAVLDQLASAPGSLLVHVNTQGTLSADQWANELHPTPEGFQLVARTFYKALLAKFPGRV